MDDLFVFGILNCIVRGGIFEVLGVLFRARDSRDRVLLGFAVRHRGARKWWCRQTLEIMGKKRVAFKRKLCPQRGPWDCENERGIAKDGEGREGEPEPTG